MTAWALGTFADGAGAGFPGLVVDARVVDLRRHLGPAVDATSLICAWDESLPRLAELATAPADHVLADLRPLVPHQPRQILCAGANYAGHVREMAFGLMKDGGDVRPDAEIQAEADRTADDLRRGNPYFFAGLPTALSGAHDDIVLWGPGEHHDWEFELAVVIGRDCRDIDSAAAMDVVAGYTATNDVTTRDLLVRPRFPMSDILMTKCRPTFFPTGPYIVPRDQIEDPTQLQLTLKLNGEVMQDGRTDDLIHSIPDLISYASRSFGLRAGDLLLTGSPSGNAAHHGGRWLRPGDVLEGEISGIGTLTNRCTSAPAG